MHIAQQSIRSKWEVRQEYSIESSVEIEENVRFIRKEDNTSNRLNREGIETLQLFNTILQCRQ